MTSATRILVPLDGSELAKQALPHARSLVGASGRIMLLRVVHTPAALRDATGAEIIPRDIAGEWMTKEARQYLDQISAELRQTLLAGVEVETLVATGDPASAILSTAQEHQADLIVMTSHGRGALGRAAYGSIADRIARSAAIPVVITRPGGKGSVDVNASIRRLIVPLDRSVLSREAIPVAKAIAQHLGSSIHLVHVIDNFSSFMANTGVPVSQSMVDQWYADSKRELEEFESELRASGIDVSSAIYQGSTAENLCEMAKPDDLIVMTSHGRSGFSRWLLGSIAEKLVRTAPVPVCLVPTRHEAPARSEAFVPAIVASTMGN